MQSIIKLTNVHTNRNDKSLWEKQNKINKNISSPCATIFYINYSEKVVLTDYW